MELRLRNTIQFLDFPDPGDNKHASAVTGVIGEDLNAAAFAHYLENEGSLVSILPTGPTQGTRIGQRLDRWIYTKNREGREILYQAEIKNWAASAIGGYRLAVDRDIAETTRVANSYWKNELRGQFGGAKQPNGITKVLVPMRSPAQYPD